METGLQKLNRQQKIAQWGERISSCRSSGLTVAQWCSENGISLTSYYKWQHRLFEMAATGGSPEFVEVTPRRGAGNSVAVIHIGEAEVEVLPGIDTNTLQVICMVLKTC